MKKKEIWPETLYMLKEVDGKLIYFISYEDKADIDNNETIGVYKFQKAQKVNKITEFVDM